MKTNRTNLIKLKEYQILSLTPTLRYFTLGERSSGLDNILF